MALLRLDQFANPAVLRAIRPDLLVRFLSPHAAVLADRGFRLPPPGSADPLDYEGLARVLSRVGPDTPAGLVDALYIVHSLSDTPGMYALFYAFTPERLGCAGPFLVEPSEAAVRAWLADPVLVQRVHAEREVEHVRRFDLFEADASPLPPFDPPAETELGPLAAALDAAFARKGRGTGTRVFVCPGSPECRFLIRRPDPPQRHAAFPAGGGEPTSVVFRPLRYDVVGYDQAAGTLRVHAGDPRDVVVYRQQFGEHLFGDMSFFPEDGRYTLDPLRAGDPACLACADVPGLAHVALAEVEVTWGGPFGGATVYRAEDVFAELARRGERLPPDATPAWATFTVGFRGRKGTRRVTVIPPYIAQYCRDEDGPAVDQWLRARRFIRPRGDREAEADDGVLPFVRGG